MAFDTSAAHCAVALLSGDRLVGSLYEPMQRGQAEQLMPLAKGLLSSAGYRWQDITRIGVGIGPGNFTGVRISVSAARGLALGLDVPAIGVSTMQALAQVAEWDGPVLATIDARQESVYAQLFDAARTPMDDIKHSPIDQIPASLSSQPLGIIGHESPQIAAQIAATPVPYSLDQLAPAIAQIAATQPPGERPAPIYLRPADAAPPKDPAPVIFP